MYTPSSNVESPEVEIICIYTGESYTHIEGDNLSIIDPKLVEGAIDVLPERFFRQPWVIRTANGGVRVFGRIE